MGVVQGHTGVGAVLSLSISGGVGRVAHVATGARAGDRVTKAKDMTYMPASDASTSFEDVVSQDDHIVQLAGDLKGHTIGLVLMRPT